MHSLKHRFLIHHYRRVLLFFCALTLTLFIGHPSSQTPGTAPAIAQALNPTQLVQDGSQAYQQGNYKEAISIWNETLEAYATDNFAERALVNQNLAIAYQQIGEMPSALHQWEAAATAYQANGNTLQFGHMLTQQAQVYTRQGQHQRALALLCGETPVIDVSANALEDAVRCNRGSYLIAQENADIEGQVAALGSLAEAYRAKGKYDEAVQMLQAGLNLVQIHSLEQYKASMLTSLGNSYARLSQVANRRANAANSVRINAEITQDLRNEANEYADNALQIINEAIQLTQEKGDLVAELPAQMNRLLLGQQVLEQQLSEQQQKLEKQQLPEQQRELEKQRLIEQHQLDKNNRLLPARRRLSELIQQLPPSRETAYAGITLAKSFQPARQDFSCDTYAENSQQQTYLEQALYLAETIEDARATSFALGELGHFEECRGELDRAISLTNQAQLAASHSLESADSLYLWEWQIGRLHKKQGDIGQAEKDYEQSINTLEIIRTEILTAQRDLQFDFRDTVEPIYRQYIELQLENTAENIDDSANTKQIINLPDNRIKGILKSTNALRLSELQNFFGDDCVLTPLEDSQSHLLKKELKTAVIHSIILNDKAVLIASFSDGDSKLIQIQNVAELKTTVTDFRRNLKRYTDKVYDQDLARKLYQELINPLETELANTGIDTLVFVQDGFFRDIPMSALYDGEQYLIQRYAIATTPSLELTATPASKRPQLRALALGLTKEIETEEGRSFSALPSVDDELSSVEAQLPGSMILQDQDFTTESLTAALQAASYSILHLATHGEFSTIPEDTFVVTGPNSSGQAEILTFGELEALIRQASPNAEPIDLIALTACETATGDDRATLGLAGVAIRSGARSAIASLWKVDDETAAELMGYFYHYLQQEQLSKAKALQQAQIEVIEKNKTNHPGYWAPMILVGSWQ